jgi:arsenate reductase-like glutaredoxin family protein
MSCNRAQEFLATHDIRTLEEVDARKERLGANEALGLLQGVNKLIVSKGRKVTKVNLKTARPEDAELVRLMLGPTGNLRAPTIKSKKTLLIGFNLEAYESVLG